MEEENEFQEYFVGSLIGVATDHDQAGSFVLPGDRFNSMDDYGSTDFDVLDIVARRNPEDLEKHEIICRLRVPLDSESLQVTGEGEVRARLGRGDDHPGTILSETSCYRDVEVSLDDSNYWNWNMFVTESAEVDGLWDRCQNYVLAEEAYEDLVYWKVGEVADGLRASLQRGIERIASEEQPDYHPNTHEIVRDYVHPSLYPYIKGVSRLTGTPGVHLSSQNRTDFWGRDYEDSVYQWLPAQFFVNENGKCSIRSYINNLPREKYSDLYTDLERLFEVFLPHFEEICGSVDSMGLTEWGYVLPELINRELQVVVKIVDYEFASGKAFEGVWHVEGMSHENIISTGLYIIERSEHILGGDLLFKRSFSAGEADDMGSQMPQSRHPRVEDIIQEGLVPIGRLRTQEGAIIVFPNSHVHKIDALWNSGEEFGRRRIIVFFLVNPLAKIISSRDVEPQQSVIPREVALEHRLRLMEERKMHKQNWNVREIELCEH